MTRPRVTLRLCLANGCQFNAVPGHRYCRRCGSLRTLAQRRRLGQQPRSRSRGGRVSVYLREGLR